MRDPGQKIRCHAVPYRQGFVEVAAGIHDGCINLETWEVRSGVDLARLAFDDPGLADADFCGHTELELTPEQARALIDQLERALRRT